MKYKLIIASITAFFWFMLSATLHAKEYIVSSPDQKNAVKVEVDKTITWSVLRTGEILIKPSKMSLSFSDGKKLGQSSCFKGRHNIH
jgi:hypothetical protein